jgi:hypothetical protein
MLDIEPDELHEYMKPRSAGHPRRISRDGSARPKSEHSAPQRRGSVDVDNEPEDTADQFDVATTTTTTTSKRRHDRSTGKGAAGRDRDRTTGTRAPLTMIARLRGTSKGLLVSRGFDRVRHPSSARLMEQGWSVVGVMN